MAYYNKQKTVFEEILSHHLDRCLALLSDGDPRAMNATRALAAVISGYADADYTAKAKALKEKHDAEIKPYDEQLKSQEITDIQYTDKTRPFDINYSMEWFEELNKLMMKGGIHPAQVNDIDLEEATTEVKAEA